MRTFFLLLALLPSLASAITVSDNTWTQQSTPTQETGTWAGTWQNRMWSTATFDTSTGTVLFYEGYTCSAPCADPDVRGWTKYGNAIWAYDADTNTLTLRRPSNWYDESNYTMKPLAANATDPTPVDRHPMGLAYVSTKDRLYIHGGLDNSIFGSEGYHPDDTWYMDPNTAPYTWTEITPSTPEVGVNDVAPTVVFDPSYGTDGTLVVNFTTTTAYSPLRTYLLDIAGETWSSFSAPTGADKYNTRSVYDSQRQLVWTYGGLDDQSLFKLDTSTQTWSVVTENSSLPPARQEYGLAYITPHDMIMAYGGSGRNDTWLYQPDANAWLQLSTATSPTAANFVDMTYDSTNDAVVALVGSSEGNGEFWLLRYQPYADDTSAHAPSAQSRPAAEAWTLDVDYGGWFLRLDDLSESAGFSYHAYSDMQAMSKDATYLAMLTDSGMQIWQLDADMTGYTLHDASPGVDNDCFWDPVNDDLLWFWTDDRLRYYNASTKVISTAVDMGTKDGWTSLYQASIKPCSNDGRYFPLFGVKSGVYVFARYDKQTETLGTVINSPCTDVEVWIAPDGDYLIANCASVDVASYNPVTGSKVADLTSSNSPHGDVIKDSAGEQWLIYQHSNNGGLWKVPLGGGTEVQLLADPVGDFHNYHVSARAIHAATGYAGDGDWVIASTYSTDATDRAGNSAYENEIIRVYLDSTVGSEHIERFVHHRSYAEDGYYSQPHASVSTSGEWVIYGSNWESAGDPDPYILWLPPVSTAAAPSEPTVGTTSWGATGSTSFGASGATTFQ